MFEMAFDSLKKATEMSLQTQQEMFKRWATLWPGGAGFAVMPGVPGVPAAGGAFAEQAQKFQKKWAEFYEEVLKKQREALAAQFQAGLKYIEESFRLAETKDPAELRAKTIELWQKVFETLHQTFEAQMRDFQSLAGRWTELLSRGAA